MTKRRIRPEKLTLRPTSLALAFLLLHCVNFPDRVRVLTKSRNQGDLVMLKRDTRRHKAKAMLKQSGCYSNTLMYCMYAKDVTLPCSTVDSPFPGSGSIFRQSRDSGVIWLWRKLITEDNRAWRLANRKQTRLSNGSCLIATFISTHPRARLFTRVKSGNAVLHC